ncbi:O-methyltransferase [bacterium]|nr:O-methyltransferase [bacterium]
MSDSKLSFVSEALDSYCIRQSNPHSKTLAELESFTRANVPASMMLTGPLEGALLAFLCRLVGAKRVLEFGTYTGYSALTLAEALPADGEVVTLDIDPENTSVAKKYWAQSAHGGKIRLLLGAASETVSQLKGPFDLVFIDADKPGYIGYLDAALEMLSPKGLVVADNCLFQGEVLQSKPSSGNGAAIARFNQRVLSDSSLDRVLLPVRDGVYLIRRR